MSDEQIRRLVNEREYWKRVASYLASCHAATLSYDGALKSCSRARRERFESIVEKAFDMMEGRDWRMGISYVKSTPERAAKDCREAIEHVRAVTK